MLAFDAKRGEVFSGSAVEDIFGDLGQLCVNIESEGTELLDVDRVALAELLVDIGHETSPDDEHLKIRVTL